LNKTVYIDNSIEPVKYETWTVTTKLLDAINWINQIDPISVSVDNDKDGKINCMALIDNYSSYSLLYHGPNVEVTKLTNHLGVMGIQCFGWAYDMEKDYPWYTDRQKL